MSTVLRARIDSTSAVATAEALPASAATLNTRPGGAGLL